MMGFFNWLSDKEEVQREEIYVEKNADFSNFKKITDFIYEKSGIIDLDKRALTSSRLQQYAISEDIYTTDEFLRTMQNREEFYQEVINIATVNETFFFREIKELEWLVQYIKNSYTNFKILSMPSSSGEEVYSILILLSEAGVDLNKIEINGFDINSNAVKNSMRGEYDEHSLHKLDIKIRDKYFRRNEEGHYEIDSSIKSHANFFQNNIFNLDAQSGKYDIVLSRNMFIYFDDEKRKEALSIIINLLKQNGIYIKGHADHIKPTSELKNILFGIYEKNSL